MTPVIILGGRIGLLFRFLMVRVEGLEPPRLAAPEPKSGASTNFATPATGHLRAGLRRCITKLVAECEG